MLCWNLANDPRHRSSFLDNMACFKGNRQLEGDLHAILAKMKADTKEWN